MNRKIEIHLGAEKRPYLTLAMGHLASWALEAYDVVDVYPDFGGQDLIAHYKNSITGRQYTIGAIWDETNQKYSFHS